MRKSLTFFALTLSLLAGSAASAGEGLFSDVSLNSARTTPNSTQNDERPLDVEEPSRQPEAEPAGELTLALLMAGYQPKEVSKDIVSVTLKFDEWSIPVLVSTTEEGQLRLTMLLSSIADGQQINSASLLKLLASNRSHQPAFFSYNEASQQVELHRLIPADAATAMRLRDELDLLAAIAKKTEKLWNIGQMVSEVEGKSVDMGVRQRPTLPTTNVSVTITPANPTPKAPAEAAAPALNLTGAWSAEISQKDAFALLFKADGTFALVHVKNGKKTQATGKSTLAGNQLTFTSTDGTRLAGTITLKSATEFEFRSDNSPANARPLTFKKAS